MQPSAFKSVTSGRLLKHPRGYWAYLPNPLPPDIPITWELANEISNADRGLSELAGLGKTLPNPYLLIGPFMRREAVLSSRIEGTEASLSDLFYFEAASDAPKVSADVREVHNYVLALEHGIKRLETLPLSLRLLREMHEKLMEGIAGPHLTPGEFRRTQNWIGPPGCVLDTATFVPPPPEELMQALGDLERFWHSPSSLPFVIRLALIHYQFEAIHPFLDGNGRIGRLLITLLLCSEQVLPQPLLYLSDYFERNRREYYRRLLAVSQRDQWTQWISFFLRGIVEQSQDAVRRAAALIELLRVYRGRLQTPRSSVLVLRLIDLLFSQPYLTISQAAEQLDVTYRSARLNVHKLVKAGILEEHSGKSYGRVFRAKEIVEILERTSM